MLYVHENCAHGYQALENDSEVYYMASQIFTPASVRGLRFDDPAFGINWPRPATAISEQDRSWPLFTRKNTLVGNDDCLTRD